MYQTNMEVVSGYSGGFVTGKGKCLSIGGDLASSVHSHSVTTDFLDVHASTSSEKKDPMRIWQEMKENGFLTPCSFSRPLSPKRKYKKRGKDVVCKKVGISKAKLGTKKLGIHMMERKTNISNVRQANRFTTLTAPSGLLKLNPGIITRMRNSEQVFSVIKALVRRDKTGNDNVLSKPADYRENKFGGNCVNESSTNSSGSNHVEVCSITPSNPLHLRSEQKEEVGTSDIEVRSMDMKFYSTMTSENASSSTSSDSVNTTSGSFSQEDATLASQWLQFLHHDIERRLAALSDSRMRVQEFIHSELPFLMEKEFSHNQESKISTAGPCISMTADLHQQKWNSLFDQMDRALNNDASHLELWHTQVAHMQSHIDRGFHRINWYGKHIMEKPTLLD